MSQIKVLIRNMYSSPPIHGARVASKIISDQDLRKQWLKELVAATERMKEMRELLRMKLEAVGAPGTWNHITDQVGMFAYTGLNKKQSKAMVEKHSIYMPEDGRISISGLNRLNVDDVAKAIKDVLQM